MCNKLLNMIIHPRLCPYNWLLKSRDNVGKAWVILFQGNKKKFINNITVTERLLLSNNWFCILGQGTLSALPQST